MATKQEFPIKRNDLLPDLVLTCLDGTTPVDLTTATAVRLHMKNLKSGIKVNAPMTVLNQATKPGQVSYAWQVGNTDTVGVFQAEVEVMWPGSKPQTFPASGYFTVKVVEELA